ncbi:hypothetical protein CONCODRAFT_15674 [Conidiobolus coronatus NRRL 28638]|uniref:Uncharacterized protein n=1 Tax=Conidiobolus coronatus (strain ATCC 28846 / CBS 209.66 / NRRL 28638) TaxID=796925 RepID=A0A137PDY0_CONC2|nr:hypothetical protein CONCODRAFT_15674 [Conidiobolus coronatus NRRL 28638]|eukprot:KXN73209.1 hypothetical protein CONCODRAFT_15674 [Conidiobolus coronatus NRRL 28638]
MDVILSSVEVVVNTVSILKYIMPEVGILTEPIIENPKKEHHDIIEEGGIVINSILQYILKEKHVYDKILLNRDLENINQVDYQTPIELTKDCSNFLNKIKIYYKRFANEFFAGLVKRGSLCVAYVFVFKYRKRIFPDYIIFNSFALASGFIGTTVLGIGVLSKQFFMLNQLKDNVETITEVKNKMYNITDNVNNLYSYKYAVNGDLTGMVDITKNVVYGMLDLENKILAIP